MSGIRHSCTHCGGSCQGLNVRLTGQQEVSRIERLAEELDVTLPLLEGRLRQTEDGRCVFLNPQHLCMIHGAYGAKSKPVVCRQYPLVALQTESGERFGIDPGCYSAYATQGSGEPVELSSLAQTTVRFEAPIAHMEGVLLALLTMSGQTVDGSIARLAGLKGSELPTGFSQRLVQGLLTNGVERACRHASAGPSVRAGLAPVLSGLPSWAERGVPTHGWTGDLERWGLEVTRRMLWLRLCPQLPSPMVVALLSLSGALVAHWASAGQPQAFAMTLAAWSRAMRSPLFWGSIFPEPQSVHYLLRGA